MPLETIEQSRPMSLRRHKRLIVNPTYQDLLCDHGLTSPDAFVALEGAIVSGHPDRHVMRLEIGGVNCYMKREHRVPIRDRVRNLLAGFDFISVSVREARNLATLARMGIAVPEWIAAGESSDGRAFLLLREAGQRTDLRALLSANSKLDRIERSRLARRLGRHLAEIHDSGFNYPDLYVKHVLADANGADFTFLDWQRSRRRYRVTWRQRCHDLAGLNASLADELADADLRLTFLIAYWRATSNHSMSFQEACKRIQARTIRLLKRSSIREQRLPKVRESQPLFWLNGEALCVTAIGRELLDPSEIARIAYSHHATKRDAMSTMRIHIDGDRVGVLTVRRGVRRVAQAKEWLRGRRSNAPECRDAAQLLREERLGEPRRLLAFGQRRAGWGVVDSFILTLADSATEGCHDDERRLAGLLAGDAKLAIG